MMIHTLYTRQYTESTAILKNFSRCGLLVYEYRLNRIIAYKLQQKLQQKRNFIYFFIKNKHSPPAFAIKFDAHDCILATPKRRKHCLLARTNEALFLSTKYVQTPAQNVFWAGVCGVPDWIRTNDTRRRRPVLYPAELRIHFFLFPKNATIFYYFLLSICKHL